MKINLIKQNNFGSLKNLELSTSTLSSLKENDILIEVYCCGISFADVLAVEGKYQDTPPLPFTPGLEISGVILDIGSKVKNFRVGDEVIALSKWGGFADKVIINENFVVSKLKKMPFDLAACMTINYGTSYYALIERAKIKPKDKILILGASGGIGLSAIEICKAIGCEVTAMASSEDKLLACKEYGADNLVLTKKDNLRDSLKDFKEITFDIIYDTVGGTYTNDSLRFIAWEGKLLIMGFASGDISSIQTNKVLLKGCDIIGIFWGPFARGNKNFNLNCLKGVSDLYNKKLIKLSKPSMFHISEFLIPLEKIKERKSIGKLCLYTDSYKGRQE